MHEISLYIMNMTKQTKNKMNYCGREGRQMFTKAIIHYPADTTAMTKIAKELAAFRTSAAIRYIQFLNLTDRQIETLFDSLAEDVAAGIAKTA